MKKTLLLLSAVLLASSASFAQVRRSITVDSKTFSRTPALVEPKGMLTANEGEQKSMIFTYAGDLANCYSLQQNKNYVLLAFEIPVEDQQPFIGAQITGINITTGTTSTNTNGIRTAYAYVSEELNAVPATKTRTALPATGATLVPVTLKDPFTITGEKPIYVGYYFLYAANNYYLPVDEILTSESKNNNLVATISTLNDTPVFSNYSNEIGSLVLSATITGDNLPTNTVSVSDMSCPQLIPQDKFSYQFKVRNTGADNINSIVVKTSVGSVEIENTVNFNTPLKSNQSTIVTIADVPSPGLGSYVLSSKVIKVNGEVPAIMPELTANVDCLNKTFPTRVVIEEGTGTWCAWCPRGIVMMEYFKEHYPDWIRIGVHSGDRMAVSSYATMGSDYFDSYPTAVANRTLEVTVAGNAGSYYTPIADYFAQNPTFVDIKLAGSVSDDDKHINVEASVEFSKDVAASGEPYGLAFVIVEDNVGPYDQNNNYSGGEYGPMAGWENKSNPVSTVYDDVARYLDGYPSIAGSLAYNITSGEVVKYNRTIAIPTAVKNKSFRLVGLVVDNKSGNILNADQIELTKNASVGSITDDKTDIRIENGQILTDSSLRVYTLDGRQVNNNNLSGLYIIVVDGKAMKVFVK